MERDYVGKTLKNEQMEDYVVLKEVTYKNIPCVYAMQVKETEDGEKKFFQISIENGEAKLVNIKSPKMIASLSEIMFKEEENIDRPRKIKENESIPEYLAYLDDYYKSKVVTIM